MRRRIVLQKLVVPLRNTRVHARSAVRRVMARIAARPVVLLYHRVAALDSDPQLLAVNPIQFEAQIAMLSRRFQVVRLEHLIANARRGELTRGGIAITFDDGYADNYEIAAPILKRHGVPATVFVTTGPVRTGREFWWDDLERMLLLAESLPESFQFQDELGSVQFSLGDDYRWTDRDRRQYRTWNVASGELPSERHKAYGLLVRICREASIARRDRLIAALHEWSNVPTDARSGYRAMDRDQVRGLAEYGVSVGGHTVNHPMLSALPVAEQKLEIETGKQDLEGLIDESVGGFAYPYGEGDHFSSSTMKLVRDAGYEWSCANVIGAVGRRTDLFAIPRVIVRSCSPERLRTILDRRDF